MAKKKPVKKRTPAKKKTPTKRKPAPKKRTPTKRKPAPAKKEEKKRGFIGRAVGKIPEKVKIRGGRSKYKSKYGTMETSYDDVEVGK